jgi:diguanylate cyclase (GGDEF)-like protein
MTTAAMPPDLEALLDEQRYREVFDTALERLAALEVRDAGDEPAVAHEVLRLHRVALRAAFHLGEAATALEHGLHGLGLADRLGDDLERAEWHNDLAVLDGVHGRYDRALEHLWSAVRAREQAGVPAAPSELNNVAAVYAETRRHDEAIALFRRAVERYREEGDEVDAALALANIGRVHTLAGRPEVGVSILEEAREAFDRLGRRDGVATTLAKLGAAHADLGARERSRACFEEALALHAEGHAVPFAEETRQHYGLAALRSGDVATAVEQLQRAVDASDDPVQLARAGILEAQSRALEADGRLEEALSALRRHVEVSEEAQLREAELVTRLRLVELEVGEGGGQEVTRLRAIDLAATNESLRRHAEELRRLSATDDLTELPNRRAIDARVRDEVERARRSGRPFVLALLDLDDFKGVNDAYGHDVGDRVLVRIARLLESSVRSIDVVARWGGEEFALLLPETAREASLPVLDRVRSAVAGEGWSDVAPDLRLTASIGVADASEADDPLELLRIADRRLFAAKSVGRDRVVVRDPR